jgi:RNA polymerase sigma-70 factor, ECF subfamily
MTLPLAVVQDLIQRSHSGDSLAYEELILAYTAPLYRLVRRFVQDEQEAESILQETFWRVWQNLARYQNDRPFYPYLVTVAVNLVRDRWRSSTWQVEEDLETSAQTLSEDHPEPEENMIAGEEHALLAEAIQQLPQPYRVVIALRYQANFSYEKMAEILDLPVNTVRTHLRRARLTLRAWMEDNYGSN